MKRQNYYKPSQEINDIQFYDLMSMDWNRFEFKSDYIEHTLSEQDIQKFYLVTQQYYNDLFLEDIIFFINRIPDPCELEVGMVIRIPAIQDIRDFLRLYKLIV